MLALTLQATFKYSNLFIYLNLQIVLFMNTFTMFFDFKQVQSQVYSRHIV